MGIPRPNVRRSVHRPSDHDRARRADGAPHADRCSLPISSPVIASLPSKPGCLRFLLFRSRGALTRITWLPFHRRAFTVSSLHFITYAFIACRGTSNTRVGACAWRRPSELDTQHRAPRRQLPRERGSGARREKIQATREKAYIRAWHSRFPLAARDRLRLQEDAFRRPRRARGHCRRGLCGLPCNG